MKGFLSTPKYADDITYAGTSKYQIDEIETKIPNRLGEYGLTANHSKTERYQMTNGHTATTQGGQNTVVAT